MRHRLLLAALAVATASAIPSVALGHEGNPNYRSEITEVRPSVPGLIAEIENFDDSLSLRNGTGEIVVVEGYEGEPYVRISPDGTVEVNQDSPTFYLNQDRFAEVSVPESADAGAPPDWRTVNESGAYSWHDHRVHYMGEGLPPQVSDESERTKIFGYRVPLTVGGEPVAVAGTLYWQGEDSEDSGFPVALLAGLAAAVAAGLAALLIHRRRTRVGGDEEAREVW